MFCNKVLLCLRITRFLKSAGTNLNELKMSISSYPPTLNTSLFSSTKNLIKLAGHMENLHRVNELVLGPKSILRDSYRSLSQLQKLTVLYA